MSFTVQDRSGSPLAVSYWWMSRSLSQSRTEMCAYVAPGVACVSRAVDTTPVDLPAAAACSRIVGSAFDAVTSALHSPRAVVWFTESWPSRAL